jgi:hypothetical protein
MKMNNNSNNKKMKEMKVKERQAKRQSRVDMNDE